MAYVDVEIEDYLDEVSDKALKAEIKRRYGKPGWEAEDDPNGPHVWTRRGMADDIREAFYSRNASRLEMILAQLELRETV